MSFVQTQSGQAAIKEDIIHYYHNDHLGTPCFLTDETGGIVWRREQTPFGVTSYERGTTIENLRFPGQYWDEEKQSSYNFYRDYTPITGRYIEADPMGNKGGLNLYIALGDNPLKYFDFYGLYATELAAVQAALVKASTYFTFQNYEYGGYIYYKKDSSGCLDYKYTGPSTINKPYNWEPQEGDFPSNDVTITSDYHSHLYQEGPSGQDLSALNSYYLYLTHGYIGVVASRNIILYDLHDNSKVISKF